MASERSSKEREKSGKRRYDSSASEDEGRSKRRRAKEDDDKGSKKKSDKREKRKDAKSHKHRSGKDKKSKDKHKQKHHKTIDLSKHGFPELTVDDYFSKNKEFATWLKDEKSVFFSDLSSESSRDLFAGFIKAWNKGKLDLRYYEGVSDAPRTSHNWNIKK